MLVAKLHCGAGELAVRVFEETIMSDNYLKPLPPLSKEQEAKVALLTDEELKIIDQVLLSNASTQWRKVARVVGGTIISWADFCINGIPDIFFAQRVQILVENGKLEASGNLNYIGGSEVRLPSK